MTGAICRRLSWGFALWLLALSPARAQADEAKPPARHPFVPGFERFHTTGGMKDELGRLLLGELNCLSCHQPGQASALVQTKQAPILDGVGGRVRAEYLRAFLNSPHQTKTGTTMPDVLAGLPTNERKQNAEALVHFLASTGTLEETPADPRKVGRGENLFHEVGCTACHAPRNGVDLAKEASVPLGELSKKFTYPSLIAFLSDPLKVRPSARMPGPRLNKNEVEEIASYLLKDLARADLLPELAKLPKIPYRYYEGEWGNLPDFEKLEPKAQGIGPAFSPSVTPSQNNFGLVFDAWFSVEREGEYEFEIVSDDGSDLAVDGKRVVSNDGVHAAQSQRGKVELAKGPHQVQVRFFQVGGEIVLKVNIGGPGLRFQPLAPLVAASKQELLQKPKPEAPKEEEDPVFVIQPELVKQGRSLFASLGCASCHQLKEGNQRIATAEEIKQRAKPLLELPLTGGCLDESRNARAPFFSLSKAQREAITGAIRSFQNKNLKQLKPEQQIASAMLRFNCYACHERNKIGGVPEARNALFLTTQMEMGDEGRIPPSLNGVGAKLTANWLKKIFREGSEDRPYMLTRMPKFGEANLGHLQPLLEEIDEIEPVEFAEIDLPNRRVKSLGRMMSGDEIFGCIKCHTFKGERALGIQSIDMTIMTQRLKHDWFHRYLINPATFRPGTRMPTAWPLGRSTLRDVLNGNTQWQIEAIWRYLEDGGNARAPQGLNRQAIVLEPGKDAVIYRNFIEGAGPRAIGVGYPEKVNLAFDANEMRLALIWQNKFIDASKHWYGRGPGFQTPLGDQVLKLETGPSLASLPSPESAWPKAPAKEQGFKFKGYELSRDNRPTFLYEYQGIRVKDAPTGLATKPFLTLKRTIKLEQTGEGGKPPLYFRAAAASKIELAGENAFRIDEDYLIRIEPAAKAFVTKQNGQSELRVPIEWTNGSASVVQEIQW